MTNVLLLRAPGTNCDNETALAFRLAGAKMVTTLHINRILESSKPLEQAQILCIPGGFSFGDDVGAGKVFASLIRNHLADALKKFRDAGKLILGICNGFQVLIKSGILLEDDASGNPATLTWNQQGRYLDRWVRLRTVSEKSVFLQGVKEMYLPIAHAEGRFVPRDETILRQLDAAGQLPLRYQGGDNPNGATLDVAGACDGTGRVFGLMPHPERHLYAIQHPQWTRRYRPNELGDDVPFGDGIAVFKNAVNYFS